MAEPLSREERRARVEDAAREELTHAAISHSTYAHAVRRWDATVRAVEAERDALRAALEKIADSRHTVSAHIAPPRDGAA